MKVLAILLALACTALYVQAQNVICGKGTTTKTVTVEDKKSYTFKTQKGKKYKGNTDCTAEYVMGDTCAKMSFSCTKFNTNNKDKKKCAKGDKVTVTANGKSKAYCKTKKPKVTSTGDITVVFTSDKKKSGTGAVCKVKCTEAATETTTSGGGTGDKMICGEDLNTLHGLLIASSNKFVAHCCNNGNTTNNITCGNGVDCSSVCDVTPTCAKVVIEPEEGEDLCSTRDSYALGISIPCNSQSTTSCLIDAFGEINPPKPEFCTKDTYYVKTADFQRPNGPCCTCETCSLCNCCTPPKDIIDHLKGITPSPGSPLTSPSQSSPDNIDIVWRREMPTHTICVSPGTNVTFSWDSNVNNHNVVRIPPSEWLSCSVTGLNTQPETGPRELAPAPNVPITTSLFFTSGVADDCDTGMKAEITISNDCNADNNLLFISSTNVVNLPSFTPVVGCTVQPYPISGIKQVVTGLVDGAIMNCGGFTSEATYSKCYSLQSGAWTAKKSMQKERWGAAACVTPDGFLVTGGRTQTTMYKSIELYKGGNWQYGTDIPIAMESHCQVYAESVGSVIVTGGNTFGAGGADKRVFKMDKVGNWSELTSMKVKRSGHSCIYMNGTSKDDKGKMWVFGGVSDFKSVEIFDLNTETWSDGKSLPSKMFYGQAVVYVNIIFVALQNGRVMMLAKDGWIDVKNIGQFGGYPTFPSPIVSRNMIGCKDD